MAGSGARDIKRKIKSVNSTRQITKAMELVSTAKLKTNRRRFDETRPFFNKTITTIADIFAKEKTLKHPLISPREVKNTLLIVVTGDRGLCGGYNINALREAEALMKTKPASKVICVGKKSKDYLRNRGYEIVSVYENISEKPSKEDSKSISDKAVELFTAGEVDEIYIVSTKMVSTISQVPKTSKIIPMNVEILKEIDEDNDASKVSQDEELKDITKYSPSPEAVLDMLIPMYLNSSILGALIEASCAEQASRRNAMENASENAKEMIDSLSLTYNQARQAAITQEITEIVSGASAL